MPRSYVLKWIIWSVFCESQLIYKVNREKSSTPRFSFFRSFLGTMLRFLKLKRIHNLKVRVKRIRTSVSILEYFLRVWALLLTETHTRRAGWRSTVRLTYWCRMNRFRILDRDYKIRTLIWELELFTNLNLYVLHLSWNLYV